MKLPFRRKQKDNVPAEIQEYYQAEKRERTGVAWLVAIVTLLLTVAIVLALFFGGRWLYRALTDNDQAADQPSSQGETPATPDADRPDNTPDVPGDDNDDTPDPATPPATPAQPGTTPTTPDNAPGAGTPPPAPPTPPAAPQPTPTPPAAGGSTGAASGKTPDTGPGEVLAIFGASSFAGAAGHRLLRARRLKRR